MAVVDRGSMVARTLLERWGLRVEPEMGQYVLRRVDQPSREQDLHVIGGDARTGVPQRMRLPLAELRDAIVPASAGASA